MTGTTIPRADRSRAQKAERNGKIFEGGATAARIRHKAARAVKRVDAQRKAEAERIAAGK